MCARKRGCGSLKFPEAGETVSTSGVRDSFITLETTVITAIINKNETKKILIILFLFFIIILPILVFSDTAQIHPYPFTWNALKPVSKYSSPRKNTSTAGIIIITDAANTSPAL